MEQNFREHGEARIWTEDCLLVIHSRGPWNAEHVLASEGRIADMIKVFAGRPWQVLGMVYGEDLHTPEAYEAQVAAIRRQRQLGRSGTALVLVDAGGSNFIRAIFARLYQAAGEPCEVFNDESSARRWLAARLARL